MLLAGATGLVGGLVLGLVSDAIPVTRRPIVGHPGVVADFDDLPPLPPARVAVCALGTTRAKAGSDAAFRAVDHDAVLAFARAAQVAGVGHCIVVTAIGADARSRLLYPRTKGDVEAALETLRFTRLDILQPGLLIGARRDRRPVEALLQRLVPLMNPILPAAMGSLPAAAVARAIVALSAETAPGVFRHDNRAIRRLA